MKTDELVAQGAFWRFSGSDISTKKNINAIRIEAWLSARAQVTNMHLRPSVNRHRDKKNPVFIACKKGFYIIPCMLVQLMPKRGTHTQAGSTILPCCVTEVGQVNCKFFVQADHSSRSQWKESWALRLYFIYTTGPTRSTAFYIHKANQLAYYIFPLICFSISFFKHTKIIHTLYEEVCKYTLHAPIHHKVCTGILSSTFPTFCNTILLL